MNVVLDITPNYVSNTSTMFTDALNDKEKRSAFIWEENPELPTVWNSLVNGSAWTKIKNDHVLGQFGAGLFDLRMNNSLVKKELISSLQHLLSLGVKGFRLNNSKCYLINPKITNEDTSPKPGYFQDQYEFYTHARTTFQDGLGELLYEYMVAVKNASMEAFLSVSEDIIEPEVYRVKTGEFGIDLPIYSRFPNKLGVTKDQSLFTELQSVYKFVENLPWLQWTYNVSGGLDPSAYSLFMSMLPGVTVIADNSAAANLSARVLKHIHEIRSSPSFMFGSFDMYQSVDIIAYSR